jgi:PPOX class probable FMN-dependent enzyme
MARIENVEALRRILPNPRPTTMAKVLTDLDEQAVAFVRKCSFLLLATTREDDGTLEVSPKGDEPGFVQVEDSRTLLMPERAGNNLAFGLQNIIANGQVGLIFLVPQTGETLRVSGRAEILDDAELLARLGSKGRPALLAIRIQIVRCYFHCARSVLRAQLWKPEAWPAPAKVSFGRVIAPRVGGDEKLAGQIDEYVTTAYDKNLWSNG